MKTHYFLTYVRETFDTWLFSTSYLFGWEVVHCLDRRLVLTTDQIVDVPWYGYNTIFKIVLIDF